MNGAELILKERQRQINEENILAEDDDQWISEELVDAASSYLYVRCDKDDYPEEWPWSCVWWKPSCDRIRNLTKAGALIAAEIDRLQRLNKTLEDLENIELQYRLNLDMDDSTKIALVKIALERIIHDEEELLNYGVKMIIKDNLKKIEEKVNEVNEGKTPAQPGT